MELTTLWFVLIAVLWTGYFVLEGFDFGVGALLPVLGRTDGDRRTMLSTIGPVWDGNEVWLITAGGATFAAFPVWYATLFSGFYLPLLLILVALIVRGVSLEYRGKRDEPWWRRRADFGIVFGSAVPALLWGVAFANFVRGVPIDRELDFAGSVLDLLHPYALLGGLTTLALFVTHGAIFLGLKTAGEMRVRAHRLAGGVGLLAAALAIAFVVWTAFVRAANLSVVASVLALALLLAGLLASRFGRDGYAFLGTAGAILLLVVSWFLALFPYVLPAIDPAASGSAGLTVQNSSSSTYTLTIMSWVALVFVPIVLAYQGWSYWVFRKRVGGPVRTTEA